jgi:hypothetical protein
MESLFGDRNSILLLDYLEKEAAIRAEHCVTVPDKPKQ